jgi:hypothetical protein
MSKESKQHLKQSSVIYQSASAFGQYPELHEKWLVNKRLLSIPSVQTQPEQVNKSTISTK